MTPIKIAEISLTEAPVPAPASMPAGVRSRVVIQRPDGPWTTMAIAGDDLLILRGEQATLIPLAALDAAAAAAHARKGGA